MTPEKLQKWLATVETFLVTGESYIQMARRQIAKMEEELIWEEEAGGDDAGVE